MLRGHLLITEFHFIIHDITCSGHLLVKLKYIEMEIISSLKSEQQYSTKFFHTPGERLDSDFRLMAHFCTRLAMIHTVI